MDLQLKFGSFTYHMISLIYPTVKDDFSDHIIKIKTMQQTKDSTQHNWNMGKFTLPTEAMVIFVKVFVNLKQNATAFGWNEQTHGWFQQTP